MRIFSEEHKRKLRENHKGMLGKKHSNETKLKMQKSRAKVVLSEKTKQEISKKISKIHKGKTKCETHKKKISESEKGKFISDETKKRISESTKGKKLSIEHRKHISESNIGRKGLSGKSNPNWQGGISTEPYCWVWSDKEFKESIKERDNYTCQNCGKIETLTEKLCLHHINYIKKDCRPNNLITVCRSCNTKANFNREYWRIFYGNKLNES